MAEIELLHKVKFVGNVLDDKNLSAATLVGDLLLTAGDEMDRIQFLRRSGDDFDVLTGLTVAVNSTGEEADLEGLASEGEFVYAVASHSSKRKKLKDDATQAQNAVRLNRIEAATPEKNVLARFRLNPEGTYSELAITSLRARLDADPILAPFAGIPCKENGIDIEGLAVRDGRLYVGFRGPVLNNNLVPVLVCGFEPTALGELRFVDLEGRGIRDLERVEDGFLILAGPVGDIDAGYRLYWWNGLDGVPGTDGSGELRPLGTLPIPADGKAEGLALERETADAYIVLVICDGLKDGGPRRFRVPKGI